MTDWSELKRLAEAATPGPWSTESNELYWLEDGYTKHLMETFDGSDICHDAEHPANLKFIAAASPTTVLALIAEVERLQRAEKNDLIAYKAAIQRQDELRKERDELKAEVEALRDSPRSAARRSYKEIELAARSIYESWADHPEYVPWVDGGNSLKQCEARRLAMSKEAGQ